MRGAGAVIQMASGRTLEANVVRQSRPRWQVEFRRVWVAQTVALFGGQVATLAIPFTAALTLGASALQMGLLAAAGQAPFLLSCLPASGSTAPGGSARC